MPIPANAYWGVDSAEPANYKLNVKGHPTLLDYVTKHLGKAPSFWGRYIGGKYALTPAEAKYIFGASRGTCAILVVYNGTTKTSVGGGRNAGVLDAQKAIAAARGVGVPGGVWLYADIEAGWQCSPEWFEGWWSTMDKSMYGGRGGVYENPTANPQEFAKPYYKALKGDAKVVLPDAPPEARYLWSTQPNKGAGDQQDHVKPAEINFDFDPAEPESCYGMTVLWQYSIDYPLTDDDVRAKVDLDLADARGYGSMWRQLGDWEPSSIG
jgi:hypothetical protein